MKKVFEFLKSNTFVIKWTIEYFIVLSLILWFLFGFNVLSVRHWWIFHHATLHGFGGFVFGMLMYSAIPIYVASTIITYRKKEPIIKIAFPETIKNIYTKIHEFVTKLFSAPLATPVIEKKEPEQIVTDQTQEFPSDMPRELYVPYTRAKENIPLASPTSTFNKQPPEQIAPNHENQNGSFPIPSDFDISDSLPDVMPQTPAFTDDGFPVFKDLDFDTPLTQTDYELSNNTTKYFDKHSTEYETYHNFVATEKYLIYEHDDNDFWVMDEDNWFAPNKQHESPIPELLELAQQNGLIPVLYLESQNIMDLPETIDKFESMGIRVIKNLDEL